MVGMEVWVHEALTEKAATGTRVDGVKAGVGILQGFVSCRFSLNAHILYAHSSSF